MCHASTKYEVFTSHVRFTYLYGNKYLFEEISFFIYHLFSIYLSLLFFYLPLQANLWISTMNELRNGVKLKKTNHTKTPIEYALTPYEMLMDDIRSRRYKLNKVSKVLNISIGLLLKTFDYC